MVGSLVAALGKAPPPERNGMGLLVGYAAALTGARAVSYVLERRRPVPRLRSMGRRLHALGEDDVPRVHHYVPGLLLAFTSGGWALLTREDPTGSWLSVLYGAGAGLTADELGLLVNESSGYWRSEPFAVAQGVLAWGAAAGLAARMAARA